MLSLLLKSGEYLTIGENIVVQIFEESGDAFRVSVKAPREIPIVRGELLERTGERPDGLYKRRPKSPSERARNAKQMDKMAARREYFAEKQALEAQQTAVLVDTLQGLTHDIEALSAAHDRGELERKLAQLRQGLDRFRKEPAAT